MKVAGMRRVAFGLSIAVGLSGCCSNGRFPAGPMGAFVRVTRDEHVEGWSLNGEKVCPKVITAAPGCYVLEVEYGASYKKHGEEDGGDKVVGFVNPLARVVTSEAKATRAEYHSGAVPFALILRQNASYYVTATFTGDEFLPRIIESNAAGERLGQIDPTSDAAVLQACRAGRSLATKTNG
jgi:hypothetical protein